MKSVPVSGFLDTFQVVKRDENIKKYDNYNQSEEQLTEFENASVKETIFQTKQIKDKDKETVLSKQSSYLTKNTNITNTISK